MLVQISKLYYIQEMTQKEIADKLNISRSNVAMALSHAKEIGIIDIQIKNPLNCNKEISEALIKRFNIDDCFVVSTRTKNTALLFEIISDAASHILKSKIKSNSILGLSWGTTIFEFMKAFPEITDLNNIHVVPLLGGTERISSEYRFNEIIEIFARKIHAEYSLMYVPAVAESVQDKKLYLQSMPMKNINKKWSCMETSIIGIGAPPEYYSGNDTSNFLELKKEFMENPKRAAGDLCGRRFNIYGVFMNNNHNRKVMAVNEQQLRAVKNVYCIVTGNHKVLSIYAALKTNIINYLIIDEPTAKNVLILADK